MNNSLFVAGLRGNQLRKLTFQNGKIVNETALLTNLGRIRNVIEHNNSLYISTSNKDGRGIPNKNDDKIIKVGFR